MNEKDKSTSTGMTRKSFLKATTLLPVAALSSARMARTETLKTAPQVVALTSRQFRFNLKTGTGLQAELIHVPTGLKLAEGDYSYSFGLPAFLPPSIDYDGDVKVLGLVGTTASGLEIRQQYRIPKDSPWIEEEITLTNLSEHPVALPDLRAGFVLPVTMEGGAVDSPLKDFKYTAVGVSPGAHRQPHPVRRLHAVAGSHGMLGHHRDACAGQGPTWDPGLWRRIIPWA